MHRQRQLSVGLHVQEKQRRHLMRRLSTQWKGRDILWETMRRVCLPRWSTVERQHPLIKHWGSNLCLCSNSAYKSDSCFSHSKSSRHSNGYLENDGYRHSGRLLLLRVSYLPSYTLTTWKVTFLSIGNFWHLPFNWARWVKVTAFIVPWNSMHSYIRYVLWRFFNFHFLYIL